MKHKQPSIKSLSTIIAGLPPQLQQEISDFIAFICMKHGSRNKHAHNGSKADDAPDLSLHQLRRAWSDEDEGLV
jgi:hypothetical protein